VLGGHGGIGAKTWATSKVLSVSPQGTAIGRLRPQARVAPLRSQF
jgi:hypothetical protein